MPEISHTYATLHNKNLFGAPEILEKQMAANEEKNDVLCVWDRQVSLGKSSDL